MFQAMDYIREIYKTGSFSSAAKNLYMTQPALSIAVKKEEKELGQPIFNRTSPRIMLTEAGEAYLSAAEKIRNIEKSLKVYCNDLSELKTGTISVGASNFFLSHVVLPVIAEFGARYPGIRIDIQEAPSLELRKRLFNETLDVIVDPQADSDDMFVSRPLFDDHFLLAAPKSMAAGAVAAEGMAAGAPAEKPLAACALTAEEIRQNIHLKEDTPAVPLEPFADAPFLLLRPETVTYERAMKICEEHGFTPKVRLQFDQLATAYRSVGAGLGVAFLSDTIVKLTPNEEQAVFYKLDSPLGKRQVAIMHKKNRYVSRAMEEFMETADRVLKREMCLREE